MEYTSQEFCYVDIFRDRVVRWASGVRPRALVSYVFIFIFGIGRVELSYCPFYLQYHRTVLTAVLCRQFHYRTLIQCDMRRFGSWIAP